jgi:HD-GYP domain-containing protein (c-di-GMP phosphodiesterase class II)
MIVSHARSITHADAGTLYLVENNKLRFVIIQNETLKIRKGGKSEEKIPFPPIEISESNVSGFAALKAMAVNIPDVYTSELFDFTGPKKFDASSGYRSQSMLVLPLKNHENEVVGVLQLLNAKNPETGQTIAFSAESERLSKSVASQAAVAITNALLISDMEKLFEAFVEVMATAIDEKSPVTGGHIRRMTDLTLLLAEEINRLEVGPFSAISFDAEQMHQLRIAALMHDIGKVTTPTEIVEKGKKLQTIFDRVHMVQLRIRYAAKLAVVDGYAKKVEMIEKGAPQNEIQALDEETRKKAADLEEIALFIGKCNEPGEFLEDDKLEMLKAIQKMTYFEVGQEYNFLTENELENLSIRKGSITEVERKKMQDHAAVTVKMLNKIPFTKKMKEIPRFAGAHHEFINGKGYPLGLKGDDIPFEGKLMAVSDIAEALTAADRPYKKAMPLEMVYKILRSMAKFGELDSNLVELFIEKNVYENYLKLKEERAKELPVVS